LYFKKVKYAVAISGVVQHFGQIWIQKWHRISINLYLKQYMMCAVLYNELLAGTVRHPLLSAFLS